MEFSVHKSSTNCPCLSLQNVENSVFSKYYLQKLQEIECHFHHSFVVTVSEEADFS